MTSTFCSEWGASQFLNTNYDDQMFSLFQTQQDEIAAASFLSLDDYSLAFDDDPNPLLLSNTFFNDQDFLFDDHDYPKRQKTDHFSFNEVAEFQNQSFSLDLLQQPQLPLPPPPPPTFQIQQQPAAQFNYGSLGSEVVISSFSNNEAKGNQGVSLSPQSVAAQHRRRRITEKTSELGKLVPCGSKMNTAEMFQAAYKYIKFLQSQVAMLKLMDSNHSIQGGLQILASPTVQEKLYSEEKCLVSIEFVETIAKNQDFESKPWLKDNIAKLMM